MRDFTAAARFNWGGAALGSCYAFMNAVSRRRGTSISGLWSVWEVNTNAFISNYMYAFQYSYMIN